MLYTAFLKGINVAGHRKIKMADLRSLLEEQKCTKVQTYIQSGNIVFEDCKTGMNKDILELKISEHFGFHVDVILIPSFILKEILKTCPFGEDHPDSAGNKTVHTFIDPFDNGIKGEIIKLKEFVSASEKLVYSSQGFWLYCPEGYGKTKLSNAFTEKKLKRNATTRNLRTLKAMVLLTEETEEDG